MDTVTPSLIRGGHQVTAPPNIDLSHVRIKSERFQARGSLVVGCGRREFFRGFSEAEKQCPRRVRPARLPVRCTSSRPRAIRFGSDSDSTPLKGLLLVLRYGIFLFSMRTAKLNRSGTTTGASPEIFFRYSKKRGTNW